MIADIPDIIAKQALLRGKAVALEEPATGRTWTYAELDRCAAKAATVMAEAGVRQGDRVAILCRNRAAFFEILFGCGKLGAILVPLNWRMPGEELEGLLADSEPVLLFYGREDAETVATLSAPPARIGLDMDYDERMAAADPIAPRHLWPADDIWYLLYTSGTTARPKGVIYNYRMVTGNYANIASAVGLRPGEVTVSYLPYFHTAGINLHSLPSLMAGGRVIILPGADIDALIGLFEARRIDTFFAVPTVYQSLIQHPRFASAPLDHVRHWCSGGAPLDVALARRCRDMGVRICNGMGMTETGPTAFVMPPPDAGKHLDSVGKPQLLSAVRIVDAEGQDVPDGEVGELLFSGPGVTPGYWRNPEATRDAFTEDGWLRSGDLARRDEEGFYYIVGRRKEMFISGGENVMPAEVERALSGHPAIAEAAVIAEPDEQWGEVGHAFLRLAENVAPPPPDELAAFCRSRIAPYKVPRRFTVVTDFPRGPAGKVQKHLLTHGLSAAG